MAQSEDIKEFKESNLPTLPHLSLEQLTNHENEISKEFNSLSKEYLESRLSRINHMLSSINYYVKNFNENDKKWQNIYNFEVETINAIKTNTEDLILSGRSGPNKRTLRTLDEYEEELKSVFKNISSPLPFIQSFRYNRNGNSENDKTVELPFESQFNKVIKPYEDDLKFTLNENNYQLSMINSKASANSVIIWKQYRSDLMNYKNKLINETYEQLNELYKEYHHINHEEMNNKEREQYFRSVVSPMQLKRSYDMANDDKSISTNHDNYYNSNTSHFKKNKIELTHEKYRILSNLEKFQKSQANPDKTSSLKYTLNSCQGLQQDEMDDDLNLLRKTIADESIVKKEPVVESQPEPIEEPQEVSAESLQQKYKQLLGLSSQTPNQPNNTYFGSLLTNPSPPLSDGNSKKLELPELPPLDIFPSFDNKRHEA